MRLPPASTPVVGSAMTTMTCPWYLALSSLADGAPRADVSLLMRNGTMAEPWYRFLARVGAPNAAVLPVDNRRLMTRPWYTYLSRL